LTAFLEEGRRDIEQALDACLSAPPAAPPVVVEAMRYSLLGGGKRMRPLLVLAAAEAVAGLAGRPRDEARRQALPAACAIELIHTYSLVHDDLPAMDNDVLRRGQPTLHVVHGEGIAILAGDGLLTEAFGLIAREPDRDGTELAARKVRAIARLAQAAGAAGMVGGQALDLQLTGQAPGAAADAGAPGLEALRDMHARKTGALIRASAVLGAIMAGADDRVVGEVDAFAADLGLAFQIVDDILDVEGDAAALGKTAGKDAAAGKLTYPLETFGIDVTGRLCLDIGASTGGFTDVLLARGAARVIALDVGHGQLHWRLRTDPRVTVIEGMNARGLSRQTLPDLGPGAGIVTIDVSFISLRLIFPRAAAPARSGGRHRRPRQAAVRSRAQGGGRQGRDQGSGRPRARARERHGRGAERRPRTMRAGGLSDHRGPGERGVPDAPQGLRGRGFVTQFPP
jgi:geranylgeranyl diphosphate synthase, type II